MSSPLPILSRAQSCIPNLPWRAFEILNKDNPVLSHVVSYRNTYGTTAIIGGEGTTLEGLLVTGGFFAALGTLPAAGRLIGFDDDREGTAPPRKRGLRRWLQRH